ncbi:N-acetyltransferase domain-containing protein [Mycena venus]|uniref:N-acetyltransferase domain-containing protein n=1 Tax=Mycena venus TaxID=2733690 RepID=A0A8H7CCD7_9AGAR|nr:N-acetyltransferase domain-containing protein [Mycena venus]
MLSIAPTRLSGRTLTFLLCVLLVKTGCMLWLRQLAQSSAQRTYSYVGEDYPRAWPIPMAGPVLMPLENTRRYMIEDPESDQEWDAMSPGKGIIHLGEQRRPFSISMFHQLRCISILRKEMVSAQKTGVVKPDSEINQHCINYMRQMLFCAADTVLDVVLGPISHPLVVPEFFECRDWQLVYDAVERNQREYPV